MWESSHAVPLLEPVLPTDTGKVLHTHLKNAHDARTNNEWGYQSDHKSNIVQHIINSILNRTVVELNTSRMLIGRYIRTGSRCGSSGFDQFPLIVGIRGVGVKGRRRWCNSGIFSGGNGDRITNHFIRKTSQKTKNGWTKPDGNNQEFLFGSWTIIKRPEVNIVLLLGNTATESSIHTIHTCKVLIWRPLLWPLGRPH